uniref:Putative localized to the inner membrane of the chloroplast-like n=1 Tax=Solanum chacoense TaxID=4108 RepID=A0A0V0H7M9_SOLCH
MTALSNSLILSKPRSPSLHFSSGSCLKSLDQNVSATKLSFSPSHGGKSYSSKRSLTIQASYSDGGRSSGSGAGIFVGGFVLGGIIVGTLGCVFAPQISKALAGADKKDLMRKLPKFIYDEDKALEKQRKKLAEKIDQLNSAIDDISTQLRSDDTPNGAAVNSDDVEAVV